MAAYGVGLLAVSLLIARVVPGQAMGIVGNMFGEQPGRAGSHLNAEIARSILDPALHPFARQRLEVADDTPGCLDCTGHSLAGRRDAGRPAARTTDCCRRPSGRRR